MDNICGLHDTRSYIIYLYDIKYHRFFDFYAKNDSNSGQADYKHLGKIILITVYYN